MNRTRTEKLEAMVAEEEKTPFDIHALTYTEHIVLRVLTEVNTALNSFEIYRKVLGYLALYDSEEAEQKALITLNATTKKHAPGFGVIASAPLAMPTNRQELNKFLAKRKKQGEKLPNYAKITRVLEDMVAMGWVKARTEGIGNAKALYFITGQVREELEAYRAKRDRKLMALFASRK